MSKQDNPTEYPVKMWTFEQWKAGEAPPRFELSTWGNNGKLAKHEIAPEHYKQVVAEQKRCYEVEVQRRFDSMKSNWNKRLEQSRDKEALLKAEVHQVHDMLHRPENWQPGQPGQRKNYHFNTYWKEYAEHVVQGNVKPYLQYYPYHDGRAGADKGRADNRTALRYAETDALHEYLNYLKAGGKNEAKHEQNETHNKLHELFQREYPKGWDEVFRTESEYLNFIKLFAAYFDSGENKSNGTIELKRGKKTSIARVLKTFYDEYGEGTLTSATGFFDLISTINEFNGESEYKIYRALIR